ncbi:MAG TPA: hypothetical protein VK629_09470 [Steroidobacteraceae bacterium]|nr:hypothetical protein [Steroidobacteraceae bacterium]
MHLSLFIFALALGMATSRPVLALPKGSKSVGYRFVMAIRFASMAATFAIIALGFYLYSWWVPIACFLILATALTLVVNRKTKPFFLKLDPVLGCGTIILCGYCWYMTVIS